MLCFEMLKKEQFLATVTTTRGCDWRARIKEIDKLGLKKAAVFPTCLPEEQERKELYALLEKSRLKEIPLVHLRSDMKPDELAYLSNKWQTKVFNTHSQKEYPFQYDYSRFKNRIYIENTYTAFDLEEIKDFAGICLDFSHLENDRLLHQKSYQQNLEALKECQKTKDCLIGCNHISAVPDITHNDLEGSPIYSIHYLKDFSELDYLKNFPANWFSSFIAIELENSLEEQLRAIEYITDMKLET